MIVFCRNEYISLEYTLQDSAVAAGPNREKDSEHDTICL